MLLRLSEVIKNRRKELKLSQPMLAELAQVSANTIFKIEKGLTNPTIDILEKIAHVLGMEINLNIKELPKLLQSQEKPNRIAGSDDKSASFFGKFFFKRQLIP